MGSDRPSFFTPGAGSIRGVYRTGVGSSDRRSRILEDMRRTTLLEHHLADGSAHFDWMLEREVGVDPDERALIAFRVAERIDRIGSGEFAAERIADHRRRYLEYEGPITRDRGRVRRLATGRLLELKMTGRELVAVIDWGAGVVGCCGRAAGDDDDKTTRWRFIVDLTPDR